MASTFVRGFTSMPPLEEIAAIEGITVVDNTVPGGLGGTPSNYGCLVAEFADMTYCLRVDANGAVLPSFRPQFALSQADFVDKFGGFDSTIGAFGASMGNGYTAAVGKTYGSQRFLCLPVNLCSAYAGRMWRQLPTCKSATDPSPIVPVVAAQVDAAYEFKTGSSRVRTGVKKVFSGALYYNAGVDGAVTNTGTPAATQSFTAAGGDFQGTTLASHAVTKGDMLIVGVLSGLGALGANAATYRVVSVTNGTTLVVELLDGSNFDWTTGTALPWRIHPASAGDTGLNNRLTDVAGYNVAARPLDATVAAATTVSPTVSPPAPTATSWAALSGLRFRTHPTQPLTYTAAIQAPNAASSASIDALYQAALDGMLGDSYPASVIGGVVCARKSSTIATATRQHVLESFAGGHPRLAFVAPPVNVNTSAQVTALTYPGVEPLRSDRLFYYWPPVLTLPIVVAVGTLIATADGMTTTDGKLDVAMDEYALALFTRLPPEESPGKASEPVPSTFATIIDYARGIPVPDLATYELLKSRGIAGIKVDSPPPQIQSAVNSLLPTQALDPKVPQNRRVFADFLIRSLAEIAKPYCKERATDAEIDSLTSALESFLTSLGPPGSGFTPQRIVAFRLQRISTPEEEELGVFKFKVDVKMVPTMDYIVLSITAGPTVSVEQVQ
jgi:hypothetical protein